MGTTDINPSRIAWSIDEIAAATSLPRSQIYKLVHTGALPAVRVGRHWRVSDAALRGWLAGDTTPAAS